MLTSHFLLFLGLTVLHDVGAAPFPELITCNDKIENGNSVHISVQAKKNQTGDWVTRFAAYGNGEKGIDGLALDLKQTVIPTNKKDSLLIQGILAIVSPAFAHEPKEELELITPELITPELKDEDFVFHERTGQNIQLSNNGRTAERLNAWDDYNHGIVITNRPLKDNELFEVRLDDKVSLWAGSVEIGVTSKTPIELPQLSYNGEYSQEYTWFYENQKFFEDKDVPKYDSYKVGDRFGVKRIPGGELQYFVNGILIGSADTKVPVGVYGIVDVYGQAAKVTIINQLPQK